MSESSKEERYGIGTLFSRRRPLYLFWKGSDISRYSFFKNIPPIFFPLGISFVFFPLLFCIYTQPVAGYPKRLEHSPYQSTGKRPFER